MVLRIWLRSFEDARTLADLATAVPFRVWISDGRQWVDAKSLLCVFSLDLRNSLTLRADCAEAAFEELRVKLEPFEH